MSDRLYLQSISSYLWAERRSQILESEHSAVIAIIMVSPVISVTHIDLSSRIGNWLIKANDADFCLLCTEFIDELAENLLKAWVDE